MQAVLAEGFTGKNLLRIAQGCPESLEASRFPAAVLVLETVCWRVGQWWDENPVSVNEGDETKRLLSQPTRAVVEALQDGDPDSVDSATKRLANAFREWRE